MSGECDKCGENALECLCDNYQCPPPIKSYGAILIIKDEVVMKCCGKRVCQ